MTGHGDAIFDADAFNRNERYDIRRAHPRVRTPVLVEINEFCRSSHAPDRRFLNSFALSHKSDHAAVVVGVHLAIQHVNAIHFHGLDDRVYFGLIAAFRKIGDTLDQR